MAGNKKKPGKIDFLNSRARRARGKARDPERVAKERPGDEDGRVKMGLHPFDVLRLKSKVHIAGGTRRGMFVPPLTRPGRHQCVVTSPKIYGSIVRVVGEINYALE